MTYYKTVQYSVWCEGCDDFLDYSVYKNLKEAEKYWRGSGWSKTLKNGWLCPDCLKVKKAQLRMRGF